MQTRENEGSSDRQSAGRGCDEKKLKEKDWSHDLEETPQLPPEAPSGATANHTANNDPQDESPKGTLIRFSFILYEPVEMMKRETRCSEHFKKLD